MFVKVIDDLPSEAVAMLQALYSRNPKSITTHLNGMRDVGSFMSTYYVGYGHKSIGDCGSTSIFIENVSMLAAKAIQDWPLYSGQEASTRYLDMAAQEFMNPIGSEGGRKVQDAWRQFYKRVLEEMVPVLMERFPIKEGENKIVWNKAIRARAFDVARGFLPAGATTMVSWHTNLRQAADHLKGMRNHPLQEVRQISYVVNEKLDEAHPSSFNQKCYPLEEEFVAKQEKQFAYYDGLVLYQFHLKSNMFEMDKLSISEWRLLTERPTKAELHHRFRMYGTIEFAFPLDFGSYRDLQRQRSCVQYMPLLTTRHGFHPWYLEQLPSLLRSEAETFLNAQERAIGALDYSLERQYYIGMGYQVPVVISCSLPSAVYIAELRSSDSVHPTLRIQAQRMGDTLADLGITMHHDRSPGTWNIKRGQQDIVM